MKEYPLMERRRALVVAGTVTATLAMAGTAMAVNLGLLGSGSDPVGDLTATDVQPAADHRPAHRQPRVRVVIQDIPVGAGGGGSSTGSVESSDADAPTATPTPAPTPAPTYDDPSDDTFDDRSDDHAEDPEEPADD